jgi:hypothetical protein
MNFVLDLHDCEECQRYWEGDLEVLSEVETAHVKKHVLEAHPELQRRVPSPLPVSDPEVLRERQRRMAAEDEVVFRKLDQIAAEGFDPSKP